MKRFKWRPLFLCTTLLVAAAAGHPGELRRATAKTDLRVSGEYIYQISDSLLRRFPSRFAGVPGEGPFTISHREYSKEVVKLLEGIIAPIKDEKTTLGLSPYVETRPFLDDSSEFYNIVAVVPGSDPALSSQFVLVGGHWDCTPWTLDGAIDCGMQVALTAGVFKAFVDYWVANDVRPQRSLMVVFFDGEEQCLCGSASATTTDVYRGMNHLELPPQANVVAYHDTDMIGANYPGRWFGRSDLDFMPLNVASAPAYLDGPTRPWAPYNATSPGFAAKFVPFRLEMLAARDRLFTDMRTKFGHSSFTYRDGQKRPLFTDAQKRYINIIDDASDRSDHSVLILQGIPSDLSIGLWDPDSAPPGLLSYHNAGETLEFLNYMYSGQQRRSAETLLGIETAGMWVAYQTGANPLSPAPGLFYLGEMNAP